MSYTVTVLLENGRRQRVPVKLNTPILVILEDVCKKQKLNADEYDLKCHNRILDVTSTVQFSGITNNAQLELVPATKSRTDSPITVILQLENGERISGPFLPSCTLWDIINGLCSEEMKLKENPVINYARQEVSGEKLKTTTLKMFGLTSGNVLLRLLHRSQDQLKTQSVASVYILPVKPKLEESTKKRKPGEGSLKDFVQQELKSDTSKNEDKTENADMNVDSSSSVSDQIEVDELSSANEALKSEEVLDSCKQVDPLAGTSDQLQTNASKKNDPPFDINDIKCIGERYALVFRTDAVQSPRFEDTSDDFFELTVEDAKTLLRDIRRTRSELEEAHLETATSKARKQSMLLERTISVYPHCIVRILFPSRLALQGVFKSTESIQDVIQFVVSFLENSNLDFYLYTSPPKTILKLNNTLLDIGAVPGINLYFGGEQVEMKAEGPFLHQRFIDAQVTPHVALQVANHFRRSGSMRKKVGNLATDLPPIDVTSSDHEKDLNPAPSRSVVRHETPKKTGVPKWFKPL